MTCEECKKNGMTNYKSNIIGKDMKVSPYASEKIKQQILCGTCENKE